MDGWMGYAKTLFNRIVKGDTAAESMQNKPQPEVQDEFLNSIFKKTTQLVKTCPKLTQEQQLTLYGLYKQANDGDNNRRTYIFNVAKPGILDFQGKAKYDSWEKCRGLPKNQAKELYIKHSNAYDQTIGERLRIFIEGGEKEQSNLSGAVSRPKAQGEPTYDHPYIQAMSDRKPIEINKEILLTFNKQPRILPLHYAIDNDLVEYVRQFLQHMTKEEVEIPDGQGMPPLEYAQLMQNEQIIKLVREALHPKS